MPTTADLMFNCNHSTTCNFCSLYSQCGSPMDLPCQDRSKHMQIFYTHGRHNKVKPYPIAITQPHATFAAFTHSVVHQWTYLARTVPNICKFFTPMEDIIRLNLIPSGDLERLLLSLPPRLGGLGFTIPTNLSAIELDASMTVTKPLYNLILQKKTHYPLSVIEAQIQAKKHSSIEATANPRPSSKPITTLV